MCMMISEVMSVVLGEMAILRCLTLVGSMMCVSWDSRATLLLLVSLVMVLRDILWVMLEISKESAMGYLLLRKCRGIIQWIFGFGLMGMMGLESVMCFE